MQRQTENTTTFIFYRVLKFYKIAQSLKYQSFFDNHVHKATSFQYNTVVNIL